MQRRLCEMSEAKWSITEAKCLLISHNKYASQRDAISYSMGYLMLSHSAGMHNTDISIAGICPNKFERAKGSKRFHFASLHYIFSAYLPTHIKSLRDFFQSLLNIHRDNLYIISKKISRSGLWGLLLLYGGGGNLGYSLESPISRTICLTTSTFTVEASSLS